MKRILHGALICALIVVMSMALWPASVSAAGTLIYVDDDFTDDPSRNMWNTITEGIADASDGAYDTVYVYAGTYNENVVVDKSNLTVLGESASLVTVIGNGTAHTMMMEADDVRVRQLKVTGATGTDKAGVYWGGVDKGYLENCDITGNYIGVLMNSIYNQTIQCNNIYNNSNDGIRLHDSKKKDLFWNNIYQNGNDGISLINSTERITIKRNESTDNGRHGIYVDSTSTLNLCYLNDFKDNGAADGFSEGSNNQWQTDNTAPLHGDNYLGNHWGDYEGSDGGYGIGDTSHPLGSEQDDYPLVNSHTTYTPHPDDEPPLCTPYEAPPDPPTPATQNPPTNLEAEAVPSDGETPTWHVDLDWQDNSDDELGFKIERKVGDDGMYSQIDTVGAGVTSYKDSDVVGGNTYHYRVRAYSSGGNSPYSNKASAATSEGGGGCFIATAAYGSYLDSHVETLRNFRDSYMVNNPVGSALVSAYYKLSPPVADFIDGHPTLKPIVRAGLMPAVAMSTVALNTTSAEKIAIVGSLALISILLIMWRRQRSRSPHTS